MIRVYWRHCDDINGDDILRCDDFTMEQAYALIELSKNVGYIKVAGKDFDDAFKFAYTEFVLGNTETHQIDHINIFVENNPF